MRSEPAPETDGTRGPAHGLARCLVIVDTPSGPLQCAVLLPAGATVATALAQARTYLGEAVADWGSAPTGIWGCRVGREAPARDGDRIEVYLPLPLDPRARRRARLQTRR